MNLINYLPAFLRNIFDFKEIATTEDAEIALIRAAAVGKSNSTVVGTGVSISVPLTYQATNITITFGANTLIYDAAVTILGYKLNGVDKLFSVEGGYVDATGFKFWPNWDIPMRWESPATTQYTEPNLSPIIVYNNKLYGQGSWGDLYEWDGIAGTLNYTVPWEAGRYISSFVVFNNKLYAGTSFTGELLEFDDTTHWIVKAPILGGLAFISALTVYNGELYALAGSGYPGTKLYKWNNTDAWIAVASQLGGEQVWTLAVFNNKLYGGTAPNGKLFEFNNVDAWIEKAPRLSSQTTITALIVFKGKLYGGTAPNGKLFEFNNVNAWIEKAPQLGLETSINSMVIFEDGLYAGTSTHAKLYKWNELNAWAEVAAQIAVNQMNITSLIVFLGRLCGGNTGSGDLLRWEGVTSYSVSGNSSLGGNILDNNFIETASESAIAIRESMLGLKVYSDETLATRRFKVKAAWNNRVPYTYEGLIAKLNDIIGAGNYSINLDVASYTLSVIIDLGLIRELNAVLQIINRMVPANLVITVTARYNTHRALATMTHTQLASYTHTELREEEIF